ncbi:transcriptional regulator [Porphyromonas canoris]|uniref:ROK family transcriptional regulator n=1 Tax=Porphyromonas canoris TaxID=36875 RepID=UPI00051D39F7|nr:ROK family transcriptional regulator [Porphyromonas canoris]KGL51217.1 transcriptional regulator [Porphyromonas canoris]
MNKKLEHSLQSSGKNLLQKREILAYLLRVGNSTLTSIAKNLGLSLPTTNKIVMELCKSGWIGDCGKLEAGGGGRHPFLYGVNADCAHFLGIDFGVNTINIALMNFAGEIVETSMEMPFRFENTMECLQNIVAEIKIFLARPTVDRDKIFSVEINMFGRVNPETGYSYSYFNFFNEPLTNYFNEHLGIETYIDNDSRACAYGEYITHYAPMESNMLFVNAAWGLGLGVIVNGKPYNGKSGFAGEFGHIHAYDNEIICRCGKKGCLETEASGSAIHRKFINRIQNGSSSILLAEKNYSSETIENVSLEEILEATIKEDILCIEILEEIGQELGKHISGLINLFNPNVVVLGGLLCKTGDYIIQPLRTAIRKYSLNMVNQDTTLRNSQLGDMAGVVGACMLARHKIFTEGF